MRELFFAFGSDSATMTNNKASFYPKRFLYNQGKEEISP